MYPITLFYKLLKSGLRLLVEILIVSTLRMRIDVAVLVENTRRIFGRAREGNLGSKRFFLTVLAGHKKLLSRCLPIPAIYLHGVVLN
jgi:hypothetical protein